MMTEKYFQNLYFDILKRINGRSVYLKNLYVVKKKFDSKDGFVYRTLYEITHKGFFGVNKIVDYSKRESLDYYSKIFDEQNITVYPILVLVEKNYNYIKTYYDLISGILLPKLEFKIVGRGEKVYNILSSSSPSELDLCCFETDFFVIDECDDFNQYMYSKKEKFPEFKIVLSDLMCKISDDEIRDYIRNYCQKDVYLKWLDFMFSHVNCCSFEKISTIPPLIPKYLEETYCEWIQQNENFLAISSKDEKENFDGLLVQNSNVQSKIFKVVSVLNTKIETLVKEKQEEYKIKLDYLIHEYNECFMIKEDLFCQNYVKYMELQQKLIDLEIDMDAYQKKTGNLDCHLLKQYFTNFDIKCERNFKEEEIDSKLVEFFRFVNYFTKNSDVMNLEDYYQNQELISSILTKLLIFYPQTREKIMENSTFYVENIQRILKDILSDSLGKLDFNDERTFSIYSILIDEMKEWEFIKSGLEISDQLESEILLEVIHAKRDVMVKERIFDK